MDEKKYESSEFDARCISPGTEFMAKFEAVLTDFVTNKMKFDRLWQKCGIVVNGSSVSKRSLSYCPPSKQNQLICVWFVSVLERVL